jgi:hypothetical protein
MATKAVAHTNVGEGGSSGPGRGVDPHPPQWGEGAEKEGRRGQGREATAVNDTCAFSIVYKGILTASCASVTNLDVHCSAFCHIMNYFCPKSI